MATKHVHQINPAALDLGQISEKYGTEQDIKDMNRLGNLQQLRRSFNFSSSFAYAIVLSSTWEFTFLRSISSLPNGGTGGSIWMYLIVAFLFYFVTLSLAEMASIAPTCGGQYHWVSEFAPRQYQKLLSFLVGWLVVLAWLTSMATTSYLVSQQIEALIVLANPKYVTQGLHSTLFTIAVTAFCTGFNTSLFHTLPLIGRVISVLHVFGFFTVVIILLAMTPHASAKQVFADFQDINGWGNVGLAVLVGTISPIETLIGTDSVCHLSEEIHDASYNLPRCMIATALFNFLLGFSMVITSMFTLGSMENVFDTVIEQPYVQVLLDATQSRGSTMVLTITMGILLLFCAINQATISSRQLFAFARDNGLPFSSFFSYVRPGWDIPLPAVATTFLFTVSVSLVLIASTTAFTVITSISGIGLIFSYLICIGCMIHKRLQKEPLPKSRFPLGKAGLYINIVAFSFLSFATIMVFFPRTPHPSPKSMNWVAFIFPSTLVLLLIYYQEKGKYKYVGPVEHVKASI